MKQIFIVGHARSGTTLTYNHITAAFALKAFPETHFFSKLWPTHQRGKSTGELQKKFFNEVIMTDVEFAKHASAEACYLAFVNQLTVSRGGVGDHICEKTPGHIHELDEIFSSFPDALIIVLVRNPVNTIASEKEIGEWYSSASKRAKRWAKGYQAALGWQKKKPNCLRFVLFEGFISDPKATISSLQDFLNLEALEDYNPDESYQHSVCDFEKWKQISSAKIVKRESKSDQLSSFEKRVITWKTNRLYRKLIGIK